MFQIQADGSDVLGFEYLDTHHYADLTPDSPDLKKIADTLDILAAVPTPPTTIRLRTIVDRWSEYVGDRSSLLGGSTIAHTDLRRHNILIAHQATLVDWAWPTLAANWFDTACVGLQLIVAGTTRATRSDGARQQPTMSAPATRLCLPSSRRLT